jgi:hypothetical protein
MQTNLFHTAEYTRMKIFNLLLTILMLSTTSALAGDTGKDVEAATANSEKVMLHPNGRWEFVDAQKAQEAKKSRTNFPKTGFAHPVHRAAPSVWVAVFRLATKTLIAVR